MNKNLLKTVIILIAVTFVTLQSCEKKGLIEEKTIKLEGIDISIIPGANKSNQDNRFSFNTLEEYENAVDILSEKGDEYILNWIGKSDFISMKNAYANNLENMPIKEDILLPSLLNKNGEIQIEDKIFKLNFDSEEVEIIEYLSGGDIKINEIYSFDDDVLVHAFELKEEATYSKGYCSSNSKTTSMSAPGGVTISCKLKYLKLGIYYKLYAKISKSGGYPSQVNIGLTTVYYNITKYENKKGCWAYTRSQSGYNNSYTLTPYIGARRLKAYRFPINFWYEHINGSNNTGLNMSCSSPGC